MTRSGYCVSNNYEVTVWGPKHQKGRHSYLHVFYSFDRTTVEKFLRTSIIFNIRPRICVCLKISSVSTQNRWWLKGLTCSVFLSLSITLLSTMFCSRKGNLNSRHIFIEFLLQWIKINVINMEVFQTKPFFIIVRLRNVEEKIRRNLEKGNVILKDRTVERYLELRTLWTQNKNRNLTVLCKMMKINILVLLRTVPWDLCSVNTYLSLKTPVFTCSHSVIERRLFTQSPFVLVPFPNDFSITRFGTFYRWN